MQRLHDRGACAVFCPCSNLWLGSGLFPIDRATDPRRPARPTASSSAAALLVTTSASSAPVRVTRCSSAARNLGPRLPVSSSSSR